MDVPVYNHCLLEVYILEEGLDGSSFGASTVLELERSLIGALSTA